MKRKHFFLIFICLSISLLVSGCGKIELYQDLSEEDANEIMVLLSENGIKAYKKKVISQNVASYSIEVREVDMVKARSLLVKHNLPRRKELGLTGVYKEKGLIPTPDEQKARYLLALKGEIINSLERIPQIIDADVVLNLPTRDEFADAEVQHRQRPTASVVVKVKPDEGGERAVSEPKLQQFVANAVEGMNPRDVTVVVTYIRGQGRTPARAEEVMSLPSKMPGKSAPSIAPPLALDHKLIGLTLDAESKDKLKIYLLIFFVILVILALALIVVIVQGSRMRRTLAALKGPAGEHPAVEGRILDEGHPELPGAPPEDEL